MEHTIWTPENNERLRHVLGGNDVAARLVELGSENVEVAFENGHAKVTATNSSSSCLDEKNDFHLSGKGTNFLFPGRIANKDEVALIKDFYDLLVKLFNQELGASVPPRDITRFTLKEDKSDVEIERELPKGFVFPSLGAFCGYLDEMIEAHQMGNGMLVPDDQTLNLFYVLAGERFVISITKCCRSDDERWYVNASEVHSRKWPKGSRVFSAAPVP